MPNLRDNHEYWNAAYDWSGGGDEWSESWGSTALLWHCTLLPRIQHLLPAGTLLEIAPGFGRWSQFLQAHCRRLVLVDLAERCIEACRDRFSGLDHIEYHVNDGRTLEAVDDGSIDVAFSFDSLVHVESEVLESYVAELAKKLTPEGVAFLHHSNLGSFRHRAALVRRLPLRAQYWLNRHWINLSGWRSETMTAERFRTACEEVGLRCTGQENIVWIYGRTPIDTLSVVTRPGSRHDRPFRRVENVRFMDEAERARELLAQYGPAVEERGPGRNEPGCSNV